MSEWTVTWEDKSGFHCRHVEAETGGEAAFDTIPMGVVVRNICVYAGRIPEEELRD